MLQVEKGWAEKQRQEASKADYDRDTHKKRGGGRREKSDNLAKATGMEEGSDQKDIYLSFSSKLVLTLY